MITSQENAQVKRLVQLNTKAKARRESGVFIVEGIRMVSEVPKDRLEMIYVSESYEEEAHRRGVLGAGQAREETKEVSSQQVPYEVLSDKMFAHVSDTQSPQGILCVVRQKTYTLEDLLPKEKPAHLLILESIQDPGNLGTMLRTGEGAGITGIICNRTTVDLYNPKTIRSTMGSVYRMPFYVTDDLEECVRGLKNRGIRICAAHLQGAVPYDEVDYRTPVGFLIGNEGNGLSEELTALSDTRILIPMEGEVESLNAAIASTILMYEVKRQRKGM